MNTILVEEVGRREQHAALGRFLDRLDAEDGPAEQATVDRVRELLS